MKYLALSFSIIAALLFTNCEGPEGPIGPVGPAGPETLPTIFERSNLTFTPNTNPDLDYTIIVDIPSSIDVLLQDAILVYRLAENDPQAGPVWQLLPQNFFLNDGTFQYNFDHSSVDVSLFIDSNFDLNTAIDDRVPNLLANQTFRFVVIPSVVTSNENIASKVVNKIISYDYDEISKNAIFVD